MNSLIPKILLGIELLCLLLLGCAESSKPSATRMSGAKKDVTPSEISTGPAKKTTDSINLAGVDPKLPKDFFEATQKRSVRHETVSPVDLDDREFLVKRLTVGLKTFMNSETPGISYELPEAADYTQIYRCQTNTLLRGTVDSVSLADLELGSKSSSEKDRIYRANDFASAAASAGCVLASTGTNKPTFYDAWAPTGSYRYLVYACVSPERLQTTENSTKRNCSRQISVSAALKDYRNTRTVQQNEILKKANALGSEVDQIARTMKNTADLYSDAITECEKKEFERAVNANKKQAVVSLAAISLDVFLELYTAQLEAGETYLSHYLTPGMDMMQMIGSLEGYSFNIMFQELAKTSNDFPKSCETGIALDQKMANITQVYVSKVTEYKYYRMKAKTLEASGSAAAGDLDVSGEKQKLQQLEQGPQQADPNSAGPGGGP